MNVSRLSRAAVGLVVIVALLAGPLVPSAFALHLLTTVYLFAAMAYAWSATWQAGGLIDLGVAAFYGLGGYLCAALLERAPLPAPEALAAAGGIAALVAGLFTALLLPGWPAAKASQPPPIFHPAAADRWAAARHPQPGGAGRAVDQRDERGLFGAMRSLPAGGWWALFAVGTLALPEALHELALRWTALTGGPAGLSLPPLAGDRTFAYAALGLVGLSVAARRGLIRFGQMTGHTAAGKPPRALAISSYAMAGLIVGLAGGLHALWFSFVDPGAVFDPGITLEVVAMALAGGSATLLGPLLGAFGVAALSEVLNAYAPSAHLPVVAAIVAGFALLAPRGVLGFALSRRRLPGPAGTPAPVSSAARAHET